MGQALRAGADRSVIDQLLSDGRLAPSALGDGVLQWDAGDAAAAGHPFPRTYALWVAWDPDMPVAARTPPASGLLSHTTALRLLGVAGDLPGPALEVTVPPGSPLRRLDGARVHVLPVPEGDWQQLHGMPATTPARAVADLAADGPVDVTDLARVVRRLIDRGVATREDLAAAFDRQPAPSPGHGERGPRGGGEFLDGLLAVAAGPV